MSEKPANDTATPANNLENLLRQISAQLSQSKGLDKLAPAFVKAWGQCANVVKNSNNPHFGNDYADLAAVLDVVKPAFSANGLALGQIPGPMVGEKITMINVIVHESGQTLGPVVTELPIGGKLTAQAAGSAHTYARRYAAQAIAGIAPVDDDGQAASAPPAKPEKPAKKKAAKSEPEEEPDDDESEDISYAETRDALTARIEAVVVGPKMNKLEATKLLTEMKEEVRELLDDEVSKAYVAKCKEVRASKS